MKLSAIDTPWIYLTLLHRTLTQENFLGDRCCFMNFCPNCNKSYSDEITFCLADGTVLVAHSQEPETVFIPRPKPASLTQTTSIRRAFYVSFGIGLAALILEESWRFQDASGEGIPTPRKRETKLSPARTVWNVGPDFCTRREGDPKSIVTYL